ncbi:unnamed protein product, partial [Phaeothamnion confervicola]
MVACLPQVALNQDGQARVIGLTLETRPDTIDEAEVRRFREYQCTRVQLGVQHTDEGILKGINRGHGVKEVATAIRLLKDNGFKVDIHLMPNLPGATIEKDAAMFHRVLTDPSLQADQWKIYPCSVVPWTVIEKWHRSGKYVPYPDEKLYELLVRTKASVHPWIRLNRVVRDIPSTYITGGCCTTNMRQHLLDGMKARALRCRCMRCREVKDQEFSEPTFKVSRHWRGVEIFREMCDKSCSRISWLQVRRYLSSGAVEYFLSFEAPDETILYGFLRLRIPS